MLIGYIPYLFVVFFLHISFGSGHLFLGPCMKYLYVINYIPLVASGSLGTWRSVLYKDVS